MAPTVASVHIAGASRLPMHPVESVTLTAGSGIPGDRYEHSRHRHLTVQSRTALEQAAADLGSPIAPAATRRNVTISGGEIPTAPGARMMIGTVEVEVVRVAAPCKLLDEVIGAGARAALRGRAGAVCRVIADGTISVGAPVILEA